MILYIVYAQFMGATWLKNFFARSCFMLPLATLLIIQRVKMGDSLNAGQAWVIALFTFLVIEISLYINMKAKATLFHKVKTTEQQQR